MAERAATRLARATVRRLIEARAGDVAAMLTFYAVLTIVPLGSFAVTVALLLVPSDAIDQALVGLAPTMPHDLRVVVREQLAGFDDDAGGALAAGQLVIALAAASRGISALRRALQAVTGRPERRSWGRVALASVTTLALVAVLAGTGLAALLVGARTARWLAAAAGLSDETAVAAVWRYVRWIVAPLAITVAWSVVYRVLPGPPPARRRLLSGGALAGAAAWLGATAMFAAYVDRFVGYRETYGAVGSVLVFLIWLWISNVALLAGAVLDDAAGRSGRARARPPDLRADELADQGRDRGDE